MSEMETKVCFKCIERKPLDEFYPRVNKCKECTRADVRANRLAKVEYYREYDRKRGSRQSPEYLAKYRQENQEKYKATNAVNNGIRDGKLKKPEACERCGDSHWRLYAHHESYDKPLDVRWLCPACHIQLHRSKQRVE